MTLSVFKVPKIETSEIFSCHSLNVHSNLRQLYHNASKEISKCLGVWVTFEDLKREGHHLSKWIFFGDLMTLNMEISFESKKVINIEADWSTLLR